MTTLHDLLRVAQPAPLREWEPMDHAVPYEARCRRCRHVRPVPAFPPSAFRRYVRREYTRVNRPRAPRRRTLRAPLICGPCRRQADRLRKGCAPARRYAHEATG